MRSACLVLISFLLYYLTSAQSNIIRAPISKRPRQKNNPSKHSRRLLSFSGSMDIENYYDTQYGASIKLGSNGKEFYFTLDTGSATMWIPGTQYATGSPGNYFDCSSSSTCVPNTDIALSIQYGQGSVYGYQITDQIQIGDLTIPQFQILSAQTIYDMGGDYFDGLLGLGLTRDPDNDLPTVLEMLKKNNLITSGIFSMYLGFEPSATGDNTGEIIFGGYDPQYAASGFQYVTVKNTSDVVYWLTDIAAVGYGWSQNLSHYSQPVIFDSGTSLMLLSESIFENFISAATAQGVTFSYNPYNGIYTCDCSAQSTLQPLTFFFKNATFNISAENYILKQNGVCNLAVSYMSGTITDTNPMIFGDTFLSNYYAIYNSDESTVGFADAKPITSFPVWAIVLIVVGGIAIIGIIIYLCYRRKKRIQQSGPINPYGGRGVAIGTGYNNNNTNNFQGQGVAIGTDYQNFNDEYQQVPGRDDDNNYQR